MNPDVEQTGAGTSLTTNTYLLEWVAETARRCQPDTIEWCDGSEAEKRRLLDRAVALTKPGGRIVYCVCSLEPEEGEQQIEALLAREPGLRRIPVEAGEIENAPFVNADGDLRTLPSHWDASHWNDSDLRMGGLDGFYAARLERR